MLAPVRQSLATDTSIRWQRVAAVPDFVYFDHHIHIAKGVGCVSCHGRVDTMPLLVARRAFSDAVVPRLPPRSGAAICGRASMSSTWNGHPPVIAVRSASKLMAANHVNIAHLTDCYTCHR